MFYTYIWRDVSGTPFYVGKGMGRRAYDTVRRSPEFISIHSQGGCTVEIADEFMLESQAHAHEMELIERYGRSEFGGPLVNKTDGGEGVSGWIPTLETRARISAAKRGRPLSADHRAKISASGMGRVNSPESIEKTASAHRGSKRNAETRARISAAAEGRVVSDETRAKIGAASRDRKRPPEVVARMAASHRGMTRSPEARARMSAAKIGFVPSKESSAKNAATKRLKGPTAGLFKGVCFDAGRAKWMASIKVDGNRANLGRHPTAEGAARAYDAAARAAWGVDCYLNFPDEADNDNSTHMERRGT